MEYQKILPPPHLRNHVRYFWTLESDTAEITPKTFKTFADGSPGIIYQQSDKGCFYQEEKKLPPVFLYGQTTRHTNIHSPASFRTIGVYFYPHALQSVFGLNASGLTDTCLDLTELAKEQGAPLSEQQLLDSGSFHTQIEVLNTYIFHQISKYDKQDGSFLPHALSRIIESGGNIPLKTLLEELGMTERSFERKFQQGVGMSPKLFARICRFQASLSQLRNNRFGKLSDIAFENEYADQSHFIRAFKEFAGFTPNKYQQRSSELVENFPEMIL
ncbi:helix-turn-helix domain-containing protein [Chitinophaga cymbidii]|uniref:HTH araC/xylS-type domain-containing protein n=1 Tax=Chitinophaga cymbidii TaxID=1096750 RepID=A0A512RQQ2_9BACT|nr:AraC family transcriptional regulator [Chitinophaga cymbidii]GEP98014.1 hypothetical protein CCY01nite_42740 [Chitinophaga cymbidii]